MNELTKVILDNEMDLILAHKQSMKLAELAGLSLGAQTTFATAVSEVSRNAIGKEHAATLTLSVSDKREKLKYITAILERKNFNNSDSSDEGYKYAKRLVQNIRAYATETAHKTELDYRLPPHFRIDDIVIEKWRINLNTDPHISPYEEIKRKNIELLQLTEKLRTSEQQYRTLTDSLPIMIFSTTAEGMITYANQWLFDYTGESVEEINETRWKNILHPDDFKVVLDERQKAYKGSDTFISSEYRLKQAKAGEYRWHTGISIAMKDEDGTIKCWNTFMVDIHAQKQIEETLKDNKQLRETQSELEDKVSLLNKSNHQLEQFAYITSHDLQEPLRKISFYSDFLQTKYGHTMPPEAISFFNNIISATNRMRTLIQDVLTYSKVHKEVFSTVSLNDIISEALCDLEMSIKEKNAEIQVDELPEIKGNQRQLKQLFENLISNSLKFARKDTPARITISGRVNDNEITITVQDNGIGFDEMYIGRIFDLFQRLHTRERYTGTGIGLAICKKIVEMHNGSIVAKGSPNNGATFFISLPVHQNEE